MEQQPCTDPELRRRLFVEVMNTGLNEGTVAVDALLLNHAKTCGACSREFSQWIQKADVGGILYQARQIVSSAHRGDPAIRCRAGQNHTFYFRPRFSGEAVGILVTTDPVGNILVADKGTLDDFLQLR